MLYNVRLLTYGKQITVVQYTIFLLIQFFINNLNYYACIESDLYNTET